MTIKEFNALRGEIYRAGLDNAEIRAALDVAGVAYIYDLTELPDKHAVIILTAKSQLNNNTLQGLGFDPDKTAAKLLLTYHRQAKTVTF